MEPEQNIVAPGPSQVPPELKKWHQSKSLIAIGILVVIIALTGWLVLNRQSKTADNSNTNNNPATSTLFSNVNNSVQITSIHNLHDPNATSKITPGSVIMIYLNAPVNFTIPLEGDQYGDGVWVSNGSYSAYLNYISREIDNTPDAKNAIGVYLINSLCPGAETMDCPLDKKVPFIEGEYSLYIKTDKGKTKSNDFKITIESTPATAKYGNFSYVILRSKSACIDQGYDTVDSCDGALGRIDSSTKKYSVLIPSLWKILPELKDTPGLLKLLFSNKDSLFFETFGYSGGEGFRYSIGYYRYDFFSNKLTKLDWTEGNCPVMSPDGAYLADYYEITGGTQIKVFSLAENKYIYSTTLPASQSVNDGTYGMGCNTSIKFDDNDTLTYTIFDASKPNDGEAPYPVITEKKKTFPTVIQMFPSQ
jgi:hypothetical protein